MNVSLTPELERLVAEKVESGMYTSASEVVREGLRLLQERDQLRRTRLEELRREIARGVEQADRGELIDGEAVFRELRERNAAAAAQREG
jgi:antitoxin ParD1/3/4